MAFDDAEPDLDQVQPGARRRGEVDVDPRVGREPVADLDPLVGGVVVHHQVQLPVGVGAVSYTHLRAHETVLDLVCRLLLEKKKKATQAHISRTTLADADRDRN